MRARTFLARKLADPVKSGANGSNARKTVQSLKRIRVYEIAPSTPGSCRLSVDAATELQLACCGFSQYFVYGDGRELRYRFRCRGFRLGALFRVGGTWAGGITKVKDGIYVLLPTRPAAAWV